MVKLGDIVKEPSLNEWWEEYVGIDYYCVSHQILIVEFEGLKWLVEGQMTQKDPVWWKVEIEKNRLDVGKDQSAEERQREIVNTIRSSSQYHRLSDSRNRAIEIETLFGEQVFSELHNPQLVVVD
jgi:hypothetical protein